MLGLNTAYMHAKFDHSSFSRSGDMVSAHQNLHVHVTIQQDTVDLRALKS